jgi:hypothetical protein
MIPSVDYNPYTMNMYYPARADYYAPTMEGYLMMPEAPPFPFNSAGTLYMCPTPLTTLPRSSRANANMVPQQVRRTDNPSSTLNSSTSPSKDSDVIDSTITSNDEPSTDDLPSTFEEVQSSSNTDAPIHLVTPNDSSNSNKNHPDKQVEQPTSDKEKENK